MSRSVRDPDYRRDEYDPYADEKGRALVQAIHERKKRRALNAYQWQRIRFGILAARHESERARMTPAQVEDLKALELTGRRVGDAGTLDAYKHETQAARKRAQ